MWHGAKRGAGPQRGPYDGGAVETKPYFLKIERPA
jgi:hypothetical protein